MPKFVEIFFIFFFLYMLALALTGASNFLIPLLVALVISYFIVALSQEIEKIGIRSFKIPPVPALITAVFILLSAVYFVIFVVGSTISGIIESIPVYQEKLKLLVHNLFENMEKPLPDLYRGIENIDFAALITKIAVVMTGLVSDAGMIAIYVIFLLAEYKYFERKLMRSINGEKAKESARKILKKINRQVRSYVIIKTFLSCITALLSGTILYLFGVDFYQFWSFLIFLLNFIPTIGSIVATIFPCLLTLLQFGDWTVFLTVTAGLTFIQVFIGNFLEPKIMGKHFNMSGLVIILSLVFWGYVWGIMGMLLSVPLMMIIGIVLANFPSTRPIAVWISRTGSLDSY